MTSEEHGRARAPGGSPQRGLRLDEVAREIPGGAEIRGETDITVHGVRHDSRTVEPGDLFVVRKGRTEDGAKYVADAIARGACAVMAGRGVLEGTAGFVPLLVVDDPQTALAHAASAVYGHPSFSLEVVGITGTNGKTTTAHLVRAAIDGALGRASCGIIGTVGHSFGPFAIPAEHTTPEADDVARTMDIMRMHGATHVAMEVSSHALSLGRVLAVRFRVAALTNLSQDHLDFHGSMRDYAGAKARLFTELGPGSSVINVDAPFGRELLPDVRAPLVRVSARVGTDADVVPLAATIDARGILARLRTPQGDFTVSSRLVGAHNLENIVLAVGVAQALDLPLAGAVDALSRETGAPGRLERCDGPDDGVIVLVDYAHTPDALTRALDAVRSATSGRVWCVFGCGGDRDATKRGPMGAAAARGADIVIVTNDNPRTEDPAVIAQAVVAGAREAGKEPLAMLDRRKAIDHAVRSAARGDLVLLAGKGHEDYQIVGTVKHPLDDRTEARLALAARRRGEGAP